jgi:hypothetical protein
MNGFASAKHQVDVRAKACSIAEVCSNASEGQTHWTMRLPTGWPSSQSYMRQPGRRSKKRAQATVEGERPIPTVSGKFVVAMGEAPGLSSTPSTRKSTLTNLGRC